MFTVFSLIKFLFQWGDLLYGIIVIHLIKEVFMVIKKRKIQLFFVLRNGLSALSLILIVFNINWGLNYYRIPLNKKLNYNVSYNETQLEKTLNILVNASNKLHEKLSNSDSVSIRISYPKNIIAKQIEDEFNFDLYKFKTSPYIKKFAMGNNIKLYGVFRLLKSIYPRISRQ